MKEKVTKITTMSEAEINKLESNIEKLKEREQDVLKLRYGLDGNGKKTQKEVGELLGLSEGTIGITETKAINHIIMIERRDSENDSLNISSTRESIKENLNKLSEIKRNR